MKSRNVRIFGRIGDAMPVPNLIEIQIDSYERFCKRNRHEQTEEQRSGSCTADLSDCQL